METNRVINAVKRHPNLAKLSKASGVSIRSLMELKHDPEANPRLRTLVLIDAGLKKLAAENRERSLNVQ